MKISRKSLLSTVQESIITYDNLILIIWPIWLLYPYEIYKASYNRQRRVSKPKYKSK